MKTFQNPKCFCFNFRMENITLKILEDTPAQFEYPMLFLGLSILSCLTIFGNALVIAAVLRERTLHTATNYFITSLAVSDILVGTVVMPFSAYYEAMDQKVSFKTVILEKLKVKQKKLIASEIASNTT